MIINNANANCKTCGRMIALDSEYCRTHKPKSVGDPS